MKAIEVFLIYLGLTILITILFQVGITIFLVSIEAIVEPTVWLESRVLRPVWKPRSSIAVATCLMIGGMIAAVLSFGSVPAASGWFMVLGFVLAILEMVLGSIEKVER